MTIRSTGTVMAPGMITGTVLPAGSAMATRPIMTTPAPGRATTAMRATT